jgi:glycosyltransferase involved in cell wall biosynthesis
MRIGMDARFLVEERTGVETYFHELLWRLIHAGGEDEILLFRGAGLLPRLPEGRWRCVEANGRAWRWGLSGTLARESLDLFYSPITSFPLRAGLKTVATVHDLSWHHAPSSYSALERLRQRRWTKLAAEHAHGIVVVSNSTGKDLSQLHPSVARRMVTISPGVDEGFFASVPHREQQRVRDRYGLPGRYLLALASFHPRKNLGCLVEAYDRFRSRNPERLQLLLAGKGGRDSARVLARVSRSPFRDDILLCGYVPREDLPALYSGAELFVLVSRYEGFGIPAVEAMASGIPVVVSDLEVFREVCGEAAFRTDPQDPESIAETIASSLRDTPDRARRLEEGIRKARDYRWETSAGKLRDYLHQVAGEAA